jgi:acyl-CoA thioesterase FadM
MINGYMKIPYIFHSHIAYYSEVLVGQQLKIDYTVDSYEEYLLISAQHIYNSSW